ncbi:MAG: hypothetical protein HY906_11110 [Deltaproteobacteria bacterium]|nr:hypothetical protein [Deltaproteobacteria bacterium]
MIVEVQLSPDPEKRYRWPRYHASLGDRLRAPATLLVVAVGAEVARWAAAPIDNGQPASIFRPLVLGPEAVPWVADETEARRTRRGNANAANAAGWRHGRPRRAVT